MEDHRSAEGEEAIRLMDQHRDALVIQAMGIRETQPNVQLVGVVFAPSTREAAKFRVAFEQIGQRHGPDDAVTGVMPRPNAVALLRTLVPALLDWLESGPGKLPLICVTEHGARLGWAPMPPA